MTLEEAQEIVRQANYNGDYISFDGNNVTLDGLFTLSEIEAICVVFRERQSRIGA